MSVTSLQNYGFNPIEAAGLADSAAKLSNIQHLVNGLGPLTEAADTSAAAIAALVALQPTYNPFIATDVSTGSATLTRSYATAKTTFAGGATENIAVQVPSGAKIIACFLRVDTIIVLGGGGVSWSAAYNTGATQSIASGKALTKNTKASTFFNVNAATAITSAATDITITPNAGTITSGVISAVVIYETLTALNSL